MLRDESDASFADHAQAVAIKENISCEPTRTLESTHTVRKTSPPDGGRDRDRTCDPLDVNEVLSR